MRFAHYGTQGGNGSITSLPGRGGTDCNSTGIGDQIRPGYSFARAAAGYCDLGCWTCGFRDWTGGGDGGWTCDSSGC